MRLLLTRGVDVNAAEKVQNTTPVMWATSGHIDVVDVLIEAGADPIGRDTSRRSPIGTTPTPDRRVHAVDAAARAGNEALVRRLLTRGANINLKNGDSASAAMVAIYNDRFDVAKTLIELGST